MRIKKEQLILVLIFLIGVSVRIILYRNEVFMSNDAFSLTRLGKNLIENGRYVFGENYNWGLFFPPGYPLLIGVTNLFINDLFISGKLVSLFSSVISILLCYLIGKELYSRESGLFSAFVYAIHPAMLGISVSAITEAFFFCLLFLSVYLFLVSLRRNNFLVYTLLGVSVGMSYLTRPEGALLLLLPFLSLNSLNPFKDTKRLFKISITLIVFLLIASPYLLFIKDSTGRFALSGKGSYLAVLLAAGVTTENIKYDRAAYPLNEGKTSLKGFNINKHSSIIDFISKNPFTFIKGYIRNAIKGLKVVLKLSMPIILPLLFALFSKNLLKEKGRWVLLLFFVLFFVIYPPFLILRRHMYPAVLFLILFSSVGFTCSASVFSEVWGFSLIRNKAVSFLVKNIKYIIIIMCILDAFTNITAITKKVVPVEHVKAAYFIKNNISSEYEKLNVMHRVPWVSYYSGARFTMLPYAHYADLINFAKLYNVDFIVIDERVLSKWEFYDELINMGKYSDDVELVYEDNSGKLIRLFKIKYKK